MCLLCIALQMRDDLPFILLANRDEYFDRPTLPSHFWPPDYDLLAGKDLKHGGTWLGVTRDGRVAAITNFREPARRIEEAPSRGALVLDFLKGKIGPGAYLSALRESKERYNGFNLIFGDISHIWWFSNRGGHRPLEKGIFAISNHLLDTPWPKVKRIKGRLLEVIHYPKEMLIGALLRALRDETIFRDEELPDTGVGMEWERILSAIFVKSPLYGTRSSHLLMVDQKGGVEFLERVYSGTDQWQDRVFHFEIKPHAEGGENGL